MDYSPRCAICPGPAVTPVRGDGPVPAQIAFIGAGPAKTEDKTGRPYTGLAGQELEDTYLLLAGLRREDVFIDNAKSCWNGMAKTPAPAACLTCALHHLPRTLDRVKPEVLILMGGSAQPVSDTRVRLDMQHGFPFWGSALGRRWEGWIVPMYEPALGIRTTPMMTQLLEDFKRLGAWLRGEWTAPEPTRTEKDYKLVEREEELRDYLDCLPAVLEMALDTESHGRSPFSLQISHTPGTARMVLSRDAALVRVLAEWARKTSTCWLLHNAPGDIDLAEGLGLRICEWRDTMQEAYQLAYLPQGLKALAYRLFGVTMRSWEDVVWPASIIAVSNWIEDGIGLAEAGLQDAEVTYLKIAPCRGCGKRGKAETCVVCGEKREFVRTEYKPGVAQQVLRHVLNHTALTAEDDKPYDPWKALARFKADGLRGKRAEDWEWDYLEQELGPMPILGIGNADIQDAVEYGSSDADHTGQVAAELEKLRGDTRWEVPQEDWDQ